MRQAKNDKEKRSQPADRIVTGQQADQKGCAPHDKKGSGQSNLAALAVTQMPEPDCTRRPRDHAGPKDRQGRQQRGRFIARRKEQMRKDQDRRGRVDIEVVVFDGRPHQGRHKHARCRV